jgi:hypothetical protein
MDGRSACIPVGGQPAVSFGAPSLGQPEELGNLPLLSGEGGTWLGGIHWQHVDRRVSCGIEGLEDGQDLLNPGLTYRPDREPRLRLDFGVRNLLVDNVTFLETSTEGFSRDNYPDRLWSTGLVGSSAADDTALATFQRIRLAGCNVSDITVAVHGYVPLSGTRVGKPIASTNSGCCSRSRQPA